MISSGDLWKVRRHGGRNRGSGSLWRIVAHGDEAICREVFEDIKRDLRQGSVALDAPGMESVKFCGAPRLKSKW
jgi:hypothetical protein